MDNTNHFIPFKRDLSALIPASLNDPFKEETPEICILASQELQDYLNENQQTWDHNFGLTAGKTGLVKGKMFGILVVESEKTLGYLCTFSGKLRDNIYPSFFVPSLFDLATNNNFLNKGMTELSEIGNRIKNLESENINENSQEIFDLKETRRIKSIGLQEELFNQYNFLDSQGATKNLFAIFEDFNKGKPPSGAGECSAPKLLHYAYKNNMKPLAIAEFWWGKATLSEGKQHKEFYPACKDKCLPILSYML